MQTKGQQMTDFEIDESMFDIDYNIDLIDLEKEAALFKLNQLEPEIITDIEQGTQEWLDMRQGFFTSSDFGKLLKQTKAEEKADKLSKGAITEVNKKVKETLYDFPDDMTIEADGTIRTSAMSWGNMYEQEARAIYSRMTTYDVKVPSFIKLGENIGASTDGLIYDNGVLEIKCHKEGTWHIKYLQINTQEELKELKFDYYAQCQGELLVSQRDWCDFVSYDPRLMYTKNQFLAVKIIRVYPDYEFQKKLAHLLNKAVKMKFRILNQFEQMRAAF